MLLMLSSLMTLVILEVGSRVIYPIEYGHQYVDGSGKSVDPVQDEVTLTPNLHYQQITQEFDKDTTHTSRGFRGPAGSFMDPDDPDIVFIGDSMTYGIGLSDRETIPYLICEDIKDAKCVNLGRPGTSQAQQIDILTHYINTYNWRPKTVVLIVNAMSGALFGGNDLTDNLEDMRRTQDKEKTQKQAQEPERENLSSSSSQPHEGVLTKLLSFRQQILAVSNLARVSVYVFGPALRTLLSPGLSQAELEEALLATKIQFDRLDDLSWRYGFEYRIFLVHPMQDLVRQTHFNTLQLLNYISPRGNVISTAPALLDRKDPEHYYYPLDGHLRPEGAKKVAAFLLQNGRLK